MQAVTSILPYAVPPRPVACTPALHPERTELSRLLLALYQAAQQAPVREFQDAILGVLKPFLPLDASAWDTATMISLVRGEPHPRCSESEEALFAELGPHLLQALAINRQVHLEHLRGGPSRETWSFGIADRRGVLYHADPRFRELLQSEWRLPGGRLPAELLQLLQLAGRRACGDKVVVEASLEQDLLFLEARERHPVDKLTAREFTVARLLASGMTHKQIALQLQRSPETVRTQAKAIFAKLGIHNVALLGPLLVLRH